MTVRPLRENESISTGSWNSDENPPSATPPILRMLVVAMLPHGMSRYQSTAQSYVVNHVDERFAAIGRCYFFVA